MAGWTPEQAETYKRAFYEFVSRIEVKTKEKGWLVLGENLFDGQIRVIEAIFEGLGNDIHDFKVLKSRQLGVSTIVRALMLFWMGVFELTGALVFDDGPHLNEARTELIDMLERLPESFRFPRKKGDNRYSLSLENRSRVNLMSVGVRASKGGRGLGSGSALSLMHRSELCNYGNVEGLEHLRHSRARVNPNRLFVDESTGLGYNIWHDIWEEAKLDHHCVCIFVGWWSHPMQRIEKDDPDFEIYGVAPLTDEERAKIKDVYARYGHEITVEQLAWVRRENNPVARQEGDADADYTPTQERLQEQPWTEDDAFQMTGSIFFDAAKLNEQIKVNVSSKFSTYSYFPGMEFVDFRVVPSPNAKSVELKVWEEPFADSVYIVAADVAFGHDEKNDRSAVQVLRCFADGLDQVAEYAWPLINTRQFAWVIASLEGWYGGDSSEVHRIVEINGPGEGTWRELMSLRHQVERGYFGDQLAQRGLQNIQRNVRNYFYTRSDSMNPGRAWQFKTNTQLKVAIMERLRDFAMNGMLRIRSLDTIGEMRRVTREGDSIAARGNAKDDRVVSLAMGVRMWDERVRRTLINLRRTRSNDEAKRRLSITDQVVMFNNAQFDAYLAGRGAQRRAAYRAARHAAWRR